VKLKEIIEKIATLTKQLHPKYGSPLKISDPKKHAKVMKEIKRLLQLIKDQKSK